MEMASVFTRKDAFNKYLSDFRREYRLGVDSDHMKVRMRPFAHEETHEDRSA